MIINIWRGKVQSASGKPSNSITKLYIHKISVIASYTCSYTMPRGIINYHYVIVFQLTSALSKKLARWGLVLWGLF